MELSSKVEYTRLALEELASYHAKGEPLKVSEIAASQAMPERYFNPLLSERKKPIVERLSELCLSLFGYKF